VKNVDKLALEDVPQRPSRHAFKKTVPMSQRVVERSTSDPLQDEKEAANEPINHKIFSARHADCSSLVRRLRPAELSLIEGLTGPDTPS
jgi:hypothetical protein